MAISLTHRVQILLKDSVFILCHTRFNFLQCVRAAPVEKPVLNTLPSHSVSLFFVNITLFLFCYLSASCSDLSQADDRVGNTYKNEGETIDIKNVNMFLLRMQDILVILSVLDNNEAFSISY